MTNPAVPIDLHSPRMIELKKYLIGTISRDMEGKELASQAYSEAIDASLNLAYANTRLNLPETLRLELFHTIVDELVGFGPIQSLLDDVR